jgi:pimeloyl-ACP methyl ester carboxylesterase
MKISEFHPFKSLKAKTKYLAFEDSMVKKWPIISEEKTVKTSYGQTFMRISGPVNGQPLVLLPGGGSNSLIWQANIEALSSVYRTYALDNIYDFGRSVYNQKMETYHDYTQWLDELFDNLSLGQTIRIAGYLFGGWVTGNYAAARPERLSKVILIAPVFSIHSVTKSFIWQMILGILPFKYTRQLSLYSAWKDLLVSGKEGKKIVDDRVEYFNIAMKLAIFWRGICSTLRIGENPTPIPSLRSRDKSATYWGVMPTIFL